MKKVDKYTYEGNTYIILGYVPFKHPDTRKWLDAVHYLQLESGLDFVREKEDGQLYFKPYGIEDLVSVYFSNDLIKV